MESYETDSCPKLKEEIESLICKGRLQEFVVKPKEADRPQPQLPLWQGPSAQAYQAVPN